MYNQKLNQFTLLRRINLQNYFPKHKFEHFEIVIVIYDKDEQNAMERAVDNYLRAMEKLDLPNVILEDEKNIEP